MQKIINTRSLLLWQFQGKKRTDDMRRYYRLKDEDEWKKEAGEKAAPKQKGTEVAPPNSSSSEDEDEEEDVQEDEASKRWARMRGLAGSDSSEDESDDDEEEDEKEEVNINTDVAAGLDVDEETEAAAIAEFGIGAMAANPREQIPLLPDATTRLACVDLDWDNIRAVDILVALRSFVPRNGSITKVTVYPSDYGLQRMAAEVKSGPTNIWKTHLDDDENNKKSQQKKKTKEKKKEQQRQTSDSENEQEEEEEEEEIVSEEESDFEEYEESASETESDGEVDRSKLRIYERSKLRWYYAVVECDSPVTANQLYDECDGMELMKSKFTKNILPLLENYYLFLLLFQLLQLHANSI